MQNGDEVCIFPGRDKLDTRTNTHTIILGILYKNTSLYKSPLSSKHKAKIKTAVWQPGISETDRVVLVSSSTYSHGLPITDAVQPVCWSSQLLTQTVLCRSPISSEGGSLERAPAGKESEPHGPSLRQILPIVNA